MNLLERVRAARSFDPMRFRPFYCNAIRIGWVRNDFVQLLAPWPRLFIVEGERVTLAPDLAPPQRTQAIDAAMRALAAEGVIAGWRNETYAIAPVFGAPALFHIERAAVRLLGLTSYSVHVNGITGSATDLRMWLARRSMAKPIDPGMIDNLIGGGLASGLSVEQTLLKEGWEEAGIDRDLLRHATPGGKVRLQREVPEGLQAEIIFTHDLHVPASFQPVNQDGEVAEFCLLPIADTIALLRESSEITLEAALVMMQFLLRRGYLSRDEPGFDEIESLGKE